MTVINLDRLEAMAKAATKGEWTADDNIVFCDGESVALDCRRMDASFIASMSPTTALALVRVAKASQRVVDCDLTSDAIQKLKCSLEGVT
jgi:hypothetical protein